MNAAPGATRAALSYYRRNLDAEGLDQSRKRPERRLFRVGTRLRRGRGCRHHSDRYHALVATDVRGGIFERCGRYLPEEAPRAVAQEIIKFVGEQ